METNSPTMTWQASCWHPHVLRESRVTKMDRGTHEGEPVLRDPIAPGSLNLLDQPVGTQQLQESAYSATLAAFLLGVVGFLQVQILGHVAAVKATLAMLPP